MQLKHFLYVALVLALFGVGTALAVGLSSAGAPASVATVEPSCCDGPCCPNACCAACPDCDDPCCPGPCCDADQASVK
jgi:hypothetical protein